MALLFVRVLNASHNIRLNAFKSLNNVTQSTPRRLFHRTHRLCNQQLEEELHRVIKDIPVNFKQTRGRYALKLCAFTFCTGVVSFIGFRIVQYELIRSKRIRADGQSLGNSFTPNQLQQYWNAQPVGQKLVFGLVGSYMTIFLLLRIPPLSAFMARNFFNRVNGKHITLLTSTFAHQTPFHLLFNTVGTYFLTRAIIDRHQDMGPEQLLAFFLTAGCFASMASIISSTMYMARPFRVAIGASGALYALMLNYAVKHPDEVWLLMGVLPMPMYQLTFAVVCFDVFAMLFRVSSLDHAAHLGGALFGLIYARYGNEMWEATLPVLRMWHKIR